MKLGHKDIHSCKHETCFNIKYSQKGKDRLMAVSGYYTIARALLANTHQRIYINNNGNGLVI